MRETTEKKRPVTRSRFGRFQVSIWKWKKVLKARDDFDAERELEIVRACVQYSRYQRETETWENQTLWCSLGELRDLRIVLDALNEDDLVAEKEAQVRPSTRTC